MTVKTLPLTRPVASGNPVLTPDGHVIVCPCLGANQLSHPEVWDLASSSRLGTLQSDGELASWTVSGDGSRIITGGADGTVRVWDARRYEMLLTLQAEGRVHALALSPDGRRLAAGTASGRLYVWTAESEERK